MLNQSQIDEFRTRGFLNAGVVIDEQQVDVLRRELTRVIENQDTLEHRPVKIQNLSGQADAPVWQIVNIWEASPPYRELMANQKIVEEIAQLTGASELRIWHDQIQYKPAQIGGVNAWHQDAPLWDIIRPMTEVSAWVALDDVDEANGCMSMVPGSHLWGNQIEYLRTISDYHAMPPTFEGRPTTPVLCPVKKGEVHYHHALTWHGSHANHSGSPRRAIAFHYMTEDTRYVAGGVHLMIPFVEVAGGEVLRGAHFPVVWPAS